MVSQEHSSPSSSLAPLTYATPDLRPPHLWPLRPCGPWKAFALQSSVLPSQPSLLLPPPDGLFTHRDTHIDGLLPCHQLADGFVCLLFALVLKPLGGQLLQRLLELLVVDDTGRLPSASRKPKQSSCCTYLQTGSSGMSTSERLCPSPASGPSRASAMQPWPGQSWLNSRAKHSQC